MAGSFGRVRQTLGWIISVDAGETYSPREVTALKAATSGQRDDFFWARLNPRLERGEAGNERPLEIVLIGTRHKGYTLESVATEPVHVYVATARGDSHELPDRVDLKDLQIEHWGILYRSKSEALSGRLA